MAKHELSPGLTKMLSTKRATSWICLLLGPDFLPPCLAFGPTRHRAAEIHLRTDVANVPACEVGELLRLPFVSLCQFTPITFRGRAFIITGPGVAQHVATLEVAAISGFLQHEVFREMCGVVTNMHTCDENVSRSWANRHLSRHWSRLTCPKAADASQLFKG